MKSNQTYSLDVKVLEKFNSKTKRTQRSRTIEFMMDEFLKNKTYEKIDELLEKRRMEVKK